MATVQDPAITLARRLRDLRENHWPGQSITQAQLAEALRGNGKLSVPLLSSWESVANPKQPPEERLAAYARFFATERSVAHRPFRLIPLADLAADERDRHDELLSELTALRGAARGGPALASGSASLLSFAPDQDIVIVCGRLPREMRAKLPYPNSLDPDHVDLYDYADLDALVELHGHIRAMNPDNQVTYRLASELEPDDYTSHLLLLGGVDWNQVARALFARLEPPVTQTNRDNPEDTAYFEVNNGQQFRPHLVEYREQRQLVEDVAHFYRGPSPFNKARTVTSFNGVFGRGTLGAVRALTDAKFRERNEAYVRAQNPRYAGCSLLMRVEVVNGLVVTPDWTVADTRLHEWVEIDRGRDTD